MKKLFSVFLSGLLFLSFSGRAQIITSDPALPTENDAVLIYYDATLGTGGLQDYTGDVYAHTGVLTSNSTGTTDWKYVKTGWGENSDATKLTRVSTNLYSLDISPSIREYYGVAEGDTVTHLAFVFRSEDSGLQGKDDGGTDIFLEVYEEGLSVSIIQPDKNQVLDPGAIFSFEAASSQTSQMSLFLGDLLVKNVTGTELLHIFNLGISGDYWIKVTAEADGSLVADSVFVHVKETEVTGSVPAGLLDGINYIDDETVTLVLYAPYKNDVFVIGEASNWMPGSASRMIHDVAADRFWLTIDDLIPGEEYAFQYLIDGDLIVPDAYTEITLDPNDKWIPEETYPGLKPYPGGKTSGICSVLQPGKSPYQWQENSFEAPAKENLVIYELLVRDFVAKHDWRTLIDTLDYLDQLGVNAIELMPVNEFEGNESWGYNPSFYFAADKYYGPADDLKAFIDACHSRGIAVLIDLVLNHSFDQSPLAQMYFSNGKPTAQNPWYNVNSPNQVFEWGNDFDHESQATKDFMDRVNLYWLDSFRVDGFRFDFTKGFTNTPGDGWAFDQSRINILKRMSDVIWAANPEAYVILEHLTDNSEETILSDYGIMLWGNMNYNYNEATMAYHDNSKSNFGGISYKSRGWSDPHLVGYMESHDEERLMFKNRAFGDSYGDYNIQELGTALRRQQMAGAFFFTVPGPKMLWQFGELGYDYSINHCPDGSIDEECRVSNKPIRWDYQDIPARRELYNVWSALINLRMSEEAFLSDDFKIHAGSIVKRIEINHSSMDVRIIGNFGVEEMGVDPNFSQTGRWYDFFSGDSIEVSNINENISLKPGEYRVYTTKKLTTPDFPVEIPAVEEEVKQGLQIWPNPVIDQAFLEALPLESQLRVFDISGRVVLNLRLEAYENQIDLSHLNPGIYLLSLSSKEGTVHAKIIKAAS